MDQVLWKNECRAAQKKMFSNYALEYAALKETEAEAEKQRQLDAKDTGYQNMLLRELQKSKELSKLKVGKAHKNQKKYNERAMADIARAYQREMAKKAELRKHSLKMGWKEIEQYGAADLWERYINNRVEEKVTLHELKMAKLELLGKNLKDT